MNKVKMTCGCYQMFSFIHLSFVTSPLTPYATNARLMKTILECSNYLDQPFPVDTVNSNCSCQTLVPIGSHTNLLQRPFGTGPWAPCFAGLENRYCEPEKYSISNPRRYRRLISATKSEYGL